MTALLTREPPNRWAPAPWSIAIALIAIGCIAAAVLSTWNSLVVSADLLAALWILPGLVALHLTQLLLAGLAWRALFTGPRPGIGVFYRLRIIREGIDSLLPVAQVGGEIVGARLLAGHGVRMDRSAASVIVDVTVEVLSQGVFLLAGLGTLAWLAPHSSWDVGLEVALASLLLCAAIVLAQRFGVLRALEVLLDGIASRWPSLGTVSLAGLHEAALDFYRHPPAIWRCAAFHLPGWALGTVESWAVLNVLGVAVTPLQALVIESLGMAGRSAGFAIPAALGAQEGGFVLAGAAVGVPFGPALALSLIKRAREVSIGLIGIALWRWSARRRAAAP